MKLRTEKFVHIEYQLLVINYRKLFPGDRNKEIKDKPAMFPNQNKWKPLEHSPPQQQPPCQKTHNNHQENPKTKLVASYYVTIQEIQLWKAKKIVISLLFAGYTHLHIFLCILGGKIVSKCLQSLSLLVSLLYII